MHFGRVSGLVCAAALTAACGGTDRTAPVGAKGGPASPAPSSSAPGQSTDDGGLWADSGGGGGTQLALDECGLSTGFPGDDQCILPPPPDQGFQIHIGPSDYTNPEAAYLMQPGYEATTNFPAASSNDADRFFFYRQYRLRPSAHHVIITVNTGPDVTLGRRIGTANLSEDYPAGGVIAPEDESVGLPIAPRAAINVSFHAINLTDAPVIRELWANFWYRDSAVVKDPAVEWFKMGSISFSVPPGAQQTLGPYTCAVQGEGRLLWLYGHRHANNRRFTVTRVRGAQRDVIYDANKWEEPLLLEYASTVTNAVPDLANGVEGGWNGVLDLVTGDTIEWSCDVDNQNATPLRFTNQTKLGEMCIIDAEAVGASCAGL